MTAFFRESAAVEERASERESAAEGERAVIFESSVARERAVTRESASRRERADLLESADNKELFRRYGDWEQIDSNGYPLAWQTIKVLVREQAGNRCLRCRHPYTKGEGEWSACDSLCTHGKPTRVVAVLPESAVNAEQAVEREITDISERAVSVESAQGEERADAAERAAKDERANRSERATKDERADLNESAEPGERAMFQEGAEDGERAVVGEDSEIAERARLSESAGDIERAVLLESTDSGERIEAQWRILTTHHLDGDKRNMLWWNLVPLCQRCHLTIQGKVRLDRVWPYEHSEWFKPYAAAWYALKYLGAELGRIEVMSRLEELLALELTHDKLPGAAW